MPDFDITQLNLMLFDVDLENADQTYSLIESLGIREITHCEDADEVRMDLMLETRDLIIVDLATSCAEGLDLIRALRYPALSAISPAPVLAFVREGSDRFVRQALQAGADNALARPFNAEQLAFQIEEMMTNRVPPIRLPLLPRVEAPGLPGEMPFPSALLRRVS